MLYELIKKTVYMNLIAQKFNDYEYEKETLKSSLKTIKEQIQNINFYADLNEIKNSNLRAKYMLKEFVTLIK